MRNSKVDLSASKISNMTDIENLASELKVPVDYNRASLSELIEDNKNILQTLRKIEGKIDKELENHKRNLLQTNPNHKTNFSPDQIKLLQDKEANNQKLLGVLEKDYANTLSRKKAFEEGLEEKITQKKNDLEDGIDICKKQIKRLKLQQKESGKKLTSYQNAAQIDYLNEYRQMQEELKVYSAKYVKVVSHHNKIADQLAIASEIDNDFEIPEQIYNRQLQEKEEAQYKQYQSIVKLCKILSKRNDSESNKAHRIYTEKLKNLERTILHLTQLDKAITYKETEILEGRKNVEIIKMKMQKREKIEKQLFRVSQTSRLALGGDKLRQKSYSSVKLAAGHISENQFPKVSGSGSKLRARGLSFGKLPMKIKL